MLLMVVMAIMVATAMVMMIATMITIMKFAITGMIISNAGDDGVHMFVITGDDDDVYANAG